MGRIPEVISCIVSRFENVVLPDDDGPDMSTIFLLFSIILSAICAIFFSCSDSDTFIMFSSISALLTRLKSPEFSSPIRVFHRENSSNILNNFG